MARRRSGWWAPTLLVAACMLLGWVIYRQLAAAPGGLALEDPAAVLAATVPDLPPDPEFAMLPIETFEGVVQRPIFSPTRTPPSEAAPVVTETGVEVSFKLKGIIIDADVRIALIRPEGAPKNLRLSVGGRVGGWTVVAIEPDRVRLERGTQERILEPTFEAPSPAKKRKLTRRQKREQKRKKREQKQQQQQQQIQDLQDELQGHLEPEQFEQLERLLEQQTGQSQN